jgi:transposase
MNRFYYIGLDIHKKTIAYCIKQANGEIVDEGSIKATRSTVEDWAKNLPGPWIGGMEATLFTGWVYDVLAPYAEGLQVGNPLRMEAITAAKKKNDRIDARTIADLVRCDLLPQCYMPPADIRDLRRVLRYRNLMVREAVRMKNKAATLLMDIGAEYNKQKLHGRKYFNVLVDRLEDVPQSVIELLKMTRGGMEMFEVCQKRLLKALVKHERLRDRIQRLMSIQGVGEVTALTWVLEIGEPQRFSSIRKAVSYCGLCSSLVESAGKMKRMPLSKQRNKHLQTILIEAAKLAPGRNAKLAAIYDQVRQRGGNYNQATVAVARKLVAYLLAVDKGEQLFVLEAAA